MIEQNAVRGMHLVGFAVVHRDPIGVELRRRVRRARIERRGFALRHFRRQAVKLRGRGLIKSHFVLEAKDADGFKEPQRAERIGIRGVFRGLERDQHVALRGEIVDFRRPHVLNDPDQVRRIGHVAVVQKKPQTRQMRILVKMIDAGGIERRRAPLDAVHDVTFVEQ